MEQVEKLLELYGLMKLYYKDLDSLAKRLQDDYNDNMKFEQEEQDRVALSAILDFIDSM